MKKQKTSRLVRKSPTSRIKELQESMKIIVRDYDNEVINLKSTITDLLERLDCKEQEISRHVATINELLNPTPPHYPEPVKYEGGPSKHRVYWQVGV